MFNLALGWTILALYAIAAGVVSVFILAIGFRLAQIREDRKRRERRLGYVRAPFRND